MKQTGTFDIIDNTPIMFAYGLPNPMDFNNVYISTFERFYGYASLKSSLKFMKAQRKYESSRQEWEVENSSQPLYPQTECVINFGKGDLVVLFTCKIGQQVEFKEIEPATKDKRSRCEITKIL